MASVCLFGSHARKTADALSDRDVLVLAANEDESSRIAAGILNKCNVSLFTHDHFLRMIEVQALFIQHIKQEGQIVRDDEGFMRTALQEFCPKQDYRPECEDAFDHLISLPTPRGSYWFDLCLSDATYVFFRNAVILHFAGNQKFIFDFSRL
jgi:predicted nucleotidyltransferase